MSEMAQRLEELEQRLITHSASQLALAARLKVLEQLVVDGSTARAGARRARYEKKVAELEQLWLSEMADEEPGYTSEIARELAAAKTSPLPPPTNS